MSLDELEKKTEASLQEIESLAKRLSASANVAESMHKRVVKEYLRERLIADIKKETYWVRIHIDESEEILRDSRDVVQDVRVHAFWSKKEHVLICKVS